MDNPGLSLFQGADLQINNSKNNEEEEDLEDQLRRKAELQNLLQANLDDFKYDDSTINSSTNISVASAENLEQLYKEAITPNEQLRVLYDVRCREIQALKGEYDKFKAEKTKEIELQKQQNLLLEAELRQQRISLKNSENLLVDKTEALNSLNKKLHGKDEQVIKLEKLVKDYEDDLATYKSEMSELQLKLQSHNGPFNLNAKYNSEELRKSLQARIETLEQAFEQENKKLEICGAEKEALQDEVGRLALEKSALEQENSMILKNFDEAQQQCKELIDVIEELKQENDHFRGRLSEFEQHKRVSLGQTAPEPAGYSEKLKKMLVDKSVELDTLKTKLRHYESGLRELGEYRQLKCDIYKKDFQTCDNPNHTKELLLMQNELQNYRRIIDDKNQQILSLNSNNKDLKEKIEEMLLQTRNEIQNISSKYNVPQLEIMRMELEKAEHAGKALSKKLEESEERRLTLLQKLEELEKHRDNLKMAESMLANERDQNRRITNEMEYQKGEILQLKNELKKVKNDKTPASAPGDYETLKTQLKNVMEHLEKSSSKKSNKKECPEIVVELRGQMDKFLDEMDKETIEKGIIEEHINSWKKLLDQIEAGDPDEVLKAQYKEAIMNLHKCEEALKDLEETMQELRNSVTIAEGEKCSLSMELKECTKKLEQSESLRLNLEAEIGRLKTLIEDRSDEKLQKVLETKDSQLSQLSEALKQFEQEKKETKKWFEKVKKEFEKLKNDNAVLGRELREAKTVKCVEENKENEIDLKTKLDEELMQCELNLRDDLQIEYQKRIADIEERYQKTFKETTELCKQQKLELERQDKKFREYLKMVLTECESCTTKLENEKRDLAGQLQMTRDDFDKYKRDMVAHEDQLRHLLKVKEMELHKSNDAWKMWSKKVVCRCLDIEATNKKVRDRVLGNMDRYEQEIAAIQQLADARLKKKSSKKRGV